MTKPTFTSQTQNSAGFSLIEMLVTVGIMAIIFALVLPSVSSYFQISMNSAVREMASIVKEAYNSTVITGRVHRLVYDIKNNSYWVESAPNTGQQPLLDTKESRERDERRSRFSRGSKTDASAEGANAFKLETSITRKKRDLPRGVSFEDVLSQQSAEPINDGTAYTHFFPHGITEKTLVHLKDDSKHHSTLVIAPLVGRTDVYDRYLTGAELDAAQR